MWTLGKGQSAKKKTQLIHCAPVMSACVVNTSPLCSVSFHKITSINSGFGFPSSQKVLASLCSILVVNQMQFKEKQIYLYNYLLLCVFFFLIYKKLSMKSEHFCNITTKTKKNKNHHVFH